jgi:nucleoside-diphosphate-sugar epimerase
VEANILALSATVAAGKVFNVGCGSRISLNNLIGHLETILEMKAQVEYLPTRAGDVRDSLADISLAKRILGFLPQVSLEDGLRKTTLWFRAIARA